jgi:NAD(P)-dependent dehydrogenase (short-subunit alcohol dehydrogenase family)
LAAEVLDAYPRLDMLINNVGGGHWTHRHITTDGLERTFALNHHLAPFLLTNLLLDRTASVRLRHCLSRTLAR